PDKQHLVWSRRDTDRVGRPDYLLEALSRRGGAIDGPRSGIGRYIDREHAFEIAIGVEDLDAPIRPVTNIDVVREIDRDRVRDYELACTLPLRSPRLHPVAVLIDFGDPRVDVPVSNVSVALRVPGDIGGLTEKAIDRR